MPVIQTPSIPTHDIGNARFTSLATPTRGSTENSTWLVEIDAHSPAVAHSLTREETFVVLSGEASVRIDGVDATASSFDAIVIPPGVEFEISNSRDEPLRLLCCFPVGGQARLVDGTMLTPPWAQ
jgi:mannose-6-phosphate isomerase-like protein (cupin superfamily)